MAIMSMDANIVRSVSLRDKLRTFRPELQNPEAVLAERRDRVCPLSLLNQGREYGNPRNDAQQPVVLVSHG